MIWTYKTMLKNYIDSYQEATLIVRNSVQVRLKRLFLTVVKNNQASSMEKRAVEIWKVRYKNIIQKDFYKEINNLDLFFKDVKFQKPNFKNLKRSAMIKKNLKEISRELYIMFKEMDKILETEFIQRDTRIQVREILNEIQKEALLKMRDKSIKFNHAILCEWIANINFAMTRIDNKIQLGMYGDSLIYQDKTNEQIIRLIRMLDLLETADKVLEKTLPNKIHTIKKQISETMFDLKEKTLNENKIQKYEDQFNYSKSVIQRSLTDLDYSNAFIQLSEILETISDFETNIQFEEVMKMFVESELSNINETFQTAKNDYENGLKAIKSNVKQNTKYDREIEFENIGETLTKLQIKWTHFYENFTKYAIYRKKVNYTILKDELIAILTPLSEVYKKMIMITRGLKNSNSALVQVENNLNSLKSILVQNENLCHKFRRISYFGNERKQNEIVLEKLLKVENQIHQTNFNFTEERIHIIKNQIDNLRSETISVKNQISNVIQQALIAESLIIYLDRFANRLNFENNFEEALRNYDNNNMVIVIDQMIKNIKQYQREKR
ncbi:MAG: hypothetical protein C5T88_04080 [Williamsoniiplasma luminosum]|uniref:Septation ring formation regulator n=2 Tax=Williamsoniiplasma luminosum TaxID=214888 RepID=A0A2S0NL19_9MOLU|nr:MAG: hypothetical protein C5T88_04080 [Williamsoniiplasma luminosum]